MPDTHYKFDEMALQLVQAAPQTFGHLPKRLGASRIVASTAVRGAINNMTLVAPSLRDDVDFAGEMIEYLLNGNDLDAAMQCMTAFSPRLRNMPDLVLPILAERGAKLNVCGPNVKEDTVCVMAATPFCAEAMQFVGPSIASDMCRVGALVDQNVDTLAYGKTIYNFIPSSAASLAQPCSDVNALRKPSIYSTVL